MPVHVSYDDEADANFRRDYGTELYEWLNSVGSDTYNVEAGTVVFDQAYVLNGLHPTTSQYDPNPDPHVTIRLSNSQLRGQNSWYIFHWRPNGGTSAIMPRPDTEQANNQRRQKRKDKKKRQQERKKDKKDKKDDKKDWKDKDSKGGRGQASTSGRRVRA